MKKHPQEETRSKDEISKEAKKVLEILREKNKYLVSISLK